ncbi:MAG: hypothetical protein ACI8TX_002317 [Hyphomicrobiaceae bacterium]|jgi:hypothetical protein
MLPDCLEPARPATKTSFVVRSAKRSLGRLPSRATQLALLAGAVCTGTLALSPLVATAGFATIEDPTGRASFEVNFRFSPTHQQVAEAQAALTRMAELVCDATDGQVRLRRVRMTTGEADEDLAGFWLHPSSARSGGAYFADGQGLSRLGSHMDVFMGELSRPDRLAHLFAHHALGLGDQYAEQRRGDGACGFGDGFGADDMDEEHHSLMQLAGGLTCVAGPQQGNACLRDDDCLGSSCEAVLASEFSTAAAHDRLRGEGGACPRSQPLSRIQIRGLLPNTAGPIGRFDATDFLTARATSSFHTEVEAVDARGVLPAPQLLLYLTHTAERVWQLAAAIDGAEIGGVEGDLVVLHNWELRFNEDSSLGAIEGGPTTITIPGLARGTSDLRVALDLGTPNPDAANNPGTGFDGLQLTKAGPVDLTVTSDGSAGCRAPWCADAWNIATGAWEATEQTVLHRGQSDWETIVSNRPYLRAPAETPEAAAPVVCHTPPEFVHDIAGADQVLLVLDNSQSMGAAAHDGVHEICANSLDDDGDGSIDEQECSATRLNAVASAVSLFLTVLEGSDVHVGAMSFSTDRENLSDIGSLTPVHAAALRSRTARLDPAADSAMGAAIEAAHERFDARATQGRTRTAILVTDGANNSGIDPDDVVPAFEARQVRWHTIGLGRAADLATLSRLSKRTGGLPLAATSGAELAPMLVELAARLRGEALVLPRKRFGLQRPADGSRSRAKASSTLASSAMFELEVEEGARELVVALTAATAKIADWKVLFELMGPLGERYDDHSSEVSVDPAWALLRITDPQPGRWRLRVFPDGTARQESAVVAFLRNPRADFFVDANHESLQPVGTVSVGASTSFVTALEGPVLVNGVVVRPNGDVVPVELAVDPITGGFLGRFDSLAGRGLYQVNVHLDVAHGASTALGETLFDGHRRAAARVPVLRRYATSSFFVDAGAWPACGTSDCDGDGIDNATENACGQDIDGDGIPSRYDLDADNDEVLDYLDGTDDEDGDGVVDFCDPRDAPSSLEFILKDQRRAIELACGDEHLRSAEYLNSARSALRRLLQNVKVRIGASDAQQARVVEHLELALKLEKNAFLIADVLPDFCTNYRATLEKAVNLEEEVREQVADILGP